MRELFYGKLGQGFIASIILLNAVLIGVQTFPAIEQNYHLALTVLDYLILGIFTLELLARLYYERWSFFSSGWNWFDLIIVTAGYLPNNESFTVCRLLRILRLFRLFSVVPQLRIIVDAMIDSIPSLGWVVVLALVFNYAFAIIGLNLYGHDFPDYFGNLPKSMYTMFEMMTRVGWHTLTRAVASKHPSFYLFIIPYILVASYIILNLIMSVIVNSMRTVQAASAEKANEEHQAAERRKLTAIFTEITKLKKKIALLENEQVTPAKPAKIYDSSLRSENSIN